MATINEMIKRFQSLDTDKVIDEALQADLSKLTGFNRLQMLDGKTKTGEDIHPTYFEDPFFKTREAAQQYSDWKDAISPPSNRRPGVPNLYINGYYHRSIGVKFTRDAYVFGSVFGDQVGIEEKYENIYGLGGEYKHRYMTEVVRPAFRRGISAVLKLSFGL